LCANCTFKVVCLEKTIQQKGGRTCGSCSTTVVQLAMQLLNFLMPQTPPKMINNNTNFWRIWCFIFAKATNPCSFVNVFGFKG
jgi:hypothetical protein